MYHHTQRCWRALPKPSSHSFSRFPVHWLVQNKQQNPKLLWNSLCLVNLKELFANYCKRGYLWKLLLLLVSLLLFRLQWLTARFVGTDKNILLLRLLLLQRKATRIFYFILQCLMQLFYMRLHWCYLHLCRHCPSETGGVVNFYKYHLTSKVTQKQLYLLSESLLSYLQLVKYK